MMYPRCIDRKPLEMWAENIRSTVLIARTLNEHFIVRSGVCCVKESPSGEPLEVE